MIIRRKTVAIWVADHGPGNVLHEVYDIHGMYNCKTFYTLIKCRLLPPYILNLDVR
jgi:hypothetical protein